MDEIVCKNDPATIRREAMCAAEYQIAARWFRTHELHRVARDQATSLDN